MCCYVSGCCTVLRFISASLPNPANGSSSSAPGVFFRLGSRLGPASLLRGFHSVPRPLGQITRPVVHQPALALEQVRAGIGRLDPVPDHMRQGRLDHLPGRVGLPTNSVKVFTGLYLDPVERVMVSSLVTLYQCGFGIRFAALGSVTVRLSRGGAVETASSP